MFRRLPAKGRTLWIVNQPSGDPAIGTSNRHFYLGRRMVELGWDVRIIGSASTDSGTKRRRPGKLWKDGVQFTLVKSRRYGGSVSQRLASWADFYAGAVNPGATRYLPRPDVVMGCLMTPAGARAGLALARRHSAKFVYEVRDLWPRTPVAFGQFGAESLPARVLGRLDRQLASSAKLIVSPLPLAHEYYWAEFGIPSDRFVWIPNGVDLRERFQVPVAAHSGEEIRLQHFGSMGRANDIDLIIRGVAAARRAGVPVRLRFVGQGDLTDAARRLVTEEQATDIIEFEGSVPQYEVATEMRWGNTLIMAMRQREALYRFGVSPNKLFDYLSAGQWVVMAADVPANPAAHAPGVSLPTPNVPSLVAALQEVASMSSGQRNRLAIKNRDIVKEHFDFEVLGARLAERLETLD